MSTRAQLPFVDGLLDLGVLEHTLGYVKNCVIGDNTFLVDPRLEDERAHDDVDTAEVSVVAVTPLSGVISEG